MTILYQAWLNLVMQNCKCPFKKMGDRQISTLTLAEFKKIYNEYKNKSPKPKQPVKQTIKKKRPRIPYVPKDEGNLYDRFEYGLSDW